MARDARKPAASSSNSDSKAQAEAAQADEGPTWVGPPKSQPGVAPSAAINIAVHSLLMLVVPFSLFFASLLGGLDPLYTLTGAPVPRKEVKSYVGAGLAVLGVNLVIASFVVNAFREKPEEPLKED